MKTRHAVPNDCAPTPFRPAQIGAYLLAALDAAEGRRRMRKRDQTPDAIGLSVKRTLLRCVVEDDPDAERFEAWLLDYAAARLREDPSGAAWAMAQSVLDEWRLAQAMPAFAAWLEQGAPSADAMMQAGCVSA